MTQEINQIVEKKFRHRKNTECFSAKQFSAKSAQKWPFTVKNETFCPDSEHLLNFPMSENPRENSNFERFIGNFLAIFQDIYVDLKA